MGDSSTDWFDSINIAPIPMYPKMAYKFTDISANIASMITKKDFKSLEGSMIIL